MSEEQLQLFYDPECAVCMRFKEWVALRDAQGRIGLVELAEGVEERFPHIDFERAAEQLTACDAQGRIYEGMAALRQVARRLPGLARLDWIYDLPGVLRVTGGVYRTVHRVRKHLCLRCGQRWTSSDKYSVRKRRAARGGRRR